MPVLTVPEPLAWHSKSIVIGSLTMATMTKHTKHNGFVMCETFQEDKDGIYNIIMTDSYIQSCVQNKV